MMNQSYYKNSIIVLLLCITFASCTSSKKTEDENKFDRIDSLRSEFLIIQDSLVYAWNIMIKDDNEKIKSLDRLLDEVKYAGVPDTMIIAEYKEHLKKLKKSRYTYTSMANSQSIDEYDLTSNTLVNEIITYAQAHPDFERNPYMQELIDEIHSAESRILFFRLDYDDFAKKYNRFVADNQDIINDIDKDHNHDKLPLFELSPVE